MGKLTEHLVLPPGSDHRPAVPVKNDVEDLGPVTDPTRTQQQRAATVVLNHLGDTGEARSVLAMLVQPVRGGRLSAEEVRRHEAAPDLEQIGKVRMWASDAGLPLDSAGRVPRTTQAAYDRACTEEAP